MLIPFEKSSESEKYKTDTKIAFEKSLASLMDKKTPKGAIYTREGRGKMVLQYVTGSWMIEQLNSVFGYNWDWEIQAEGLGSIQVWVRGILTVRSYQDDGTVITVTKSAYGGADIKKYGASNSKSGEVIDLADDLKSASTDAMKKAASLLGFAGDLYGRSGEATQSKGGLDETQLKAIRFRATELGMGEEELDKWVKAQDKINSGKKSLTELTGGQVQALLIELVKQDTARKRLAASTDKGKSN